MELGFWFNYRWIGGASAEILVNTRFADVSGSGVIGFFVLSSLVTAGFFVSCTIFHLK